MIDSSKLIADLTVEEFIPVIVSGIAVFLCLVALLFAIGFLISLAFSKCLELDSKGKAKKKEKLKEEMLDEIVEGMMLWYKLNGDDDGKSK